MPPLALLLGSASEYMVDRFLNFSVPIFVWSIVPKEAHWVLAAPGLGAQFFIQYIH